MSITPITIENPGITGKRFRCVLIGFKRQIGDIAPTKERPQATHFDNVLFYFAESYFEFGDTNRGIYADGFLKGSFKSPLLEVYKCKTTDFEDITSIPFEEFVTDFREKYLFHPCSCMVQVNDYGDFDVAAINFDPRSVYDYMNSGEDSAAKTASYTG